MASSSCTEWGDKQPVLFAFSLYLQFHRYLKRYHPNHPFSRKRSPRLPSYVLRESDFTSFSYGSFIQTPLLNQSRLYQFSHSFPHVCWQTRNDLKTKIPLQKPYWFFPERSCLHRCLLLEWLPVSWHRSHLQDCASRFHLNLFSRKNIMS